VIAAGAGNIRFPDPGERTPTILVVEDEILIRFVISDYLQHCGFRVHVAGDAEEAIQILQAADPIDVVFSDVVMPGEMDGFGLAQWIRKNRPGLPIILTSADAKKAMAAKELCENEPFFAKPYDVVQVVAEIRAVIEGKTRKD
jgi:CheY-like chemotaxis protein